MRSALNVSMDQGFFYTNTRVPAVSRNWLNTVLYYKYVYVPHNEPDIIC